MSFFRLFAVLAYIFAMLFSSFASSFSVCFSASLFFFAISHGLSLLSLFGFGSFLRLKDCRHAYAAFRHLKGAVIRNLDLIPIGVNHGHRHKAVAFLRLRCQRHGFSRLRLLRLGMKKAGFLPPPVFLISFSFPAFRPDASAPHQSFLIRSSAATVFS